MKVRLTVVFLAVLTLLGTGLSICASGSAETPQTSTSSSTNCTVRQAVYTSGPNVKLVQQVYGCANMDFVDEQLWFEDGDTQLKYIHYTTNQCTDENHTLSRCVRIFRYYFPNPHGLQDWNVCAELNWGNVLSGGTNYEHCYGRKV